MTEGDVSIQDLVQDKANLVKGNTAADSDQIQIWDGTKFTTYYYRKQVTGSKGAFTYPDCWVDGTTTTTASKPAEKTIPRGAGVWFARPSTASAGTITLSGSVGSEKKNLHINPGFNMIGSAFPVDIDVNAENCPIDWGACAIKGNTAADSDQIQIWNGSKFTTYYYRKQVTGSKGAFTYPDCWVDGTTTTTASQPANLKIDAGKGFWYARPSTSAAGSLVQESPIAK